ncbi:MAG: capsular biosynthesis protein [Clostridiales bacterium]|uniref:tetratricopeptide repeat protein n=1 Tax=Clostridium sp. N3C TaxID=1776758 RepID=UPI00092E0A92|nr:tetratricopeptide repeat protein [Clostridium sp. N3C]NLZ48464.1 capsular biosynthesis protein [Clostridiales bacterium]SCN21461.1 photosystem I assembly protein Ycf3 [Clostridium sp. N3C]
MLNRSLLSSKLSNFIFLDINKDVLQKIFNVSVEDSVYLPIRANKIIDEIKLNNNLEEIPVKYFVEGMYYVIGCDEGFRYVTTYKKIIKTNDWCSLTVKAIIADYVKNNDYLESYVLLRGLFITNIDEDIYNKMLWCLNTSLKSNKTYLDEFNELLDYGKELKFPMAFFYESLLYNEEGKYVDALNSLNLYYSYGGKSEAEVSEYNEKLKLLADFEKGKENVKTNPEYALKLLLPLLEEMEKDAFLYYYIAIAYRNLGANHKAIYYLNEAIAIDKDILDLYNELGLNYACLGDFNTAITYFRKVFEVTRSVEVCTNLIMCYINIGDIKQAKIHLEIAKKIDREDEVLKDIEKILEGGS